MTLQKLAILLRAKPFGVDPEGAAVERHELKLYQELSAVTRAIGQSIDMSGVPHNPSEPSGQEPMQELHECVQDVAVAAL